MSMSSALCREQEASERQRAEHSSLENVRLTAMRAADAWRKEGVSAHAREQRDVVRLSRAKFAQPVMSSEGPTGSSPAHGDAS